MNTHAHISTNRQHTDPTNMSSTNPFESPHASDDEQQQQQPETGINTNPFIDHPSTTRSTIANTIQVPPSFVGQRTTARHPSGVISSIASNLSTQQQQQQQQQQQHQHHHHEADSASGTNTASTPPIESTWNYLGDLPYRRVPIYQNIQWNTKSPPMSISTSSTSHTAPSSSTTTAATTTTTTTTAATTTNEQPSGLLEGGLAAFPASYLSAAECLDVDIRDLLSTTTITKVAACPNGGPIAVITLPKLRMSDINNNNNNNNNNNPNMNTTMLRIMSCSGKTLSNVPFPPQSLLHHNNELGSSSNFKLGQYGPSDLMEMGFTNRCNLVLVLRDGLCLVYDVSGNLLLTPFYILPSGAGGSNVELMSASVFEGGVAVLSTGMQCALVELLDEHDDVNYVDGAHLASRRIVGNGPIGSGSSADGNPNESALLDAGRGEVFGGMRGGPPPPHFAIVTPLPTAGHAHMFGYHFIALAVLPRIHTTSRRPELFLSTSDNSVVIVDTATTEIIDVDCRARVSSPIISMSFAPNGRFLACFTQNCTLTVISTNFETKVLDFDTSEGSPHPPRQMKWCGEDSVVLHWKNLGVLMVGPYGDWLRFPYEGVENLHLIPEMDCCRVVTDDAVEILQRVPPDTHMFLQIGSLEPAAMLLDASSAFERGLPTADEAARAILKSGRLEEAMDVCIEAAMKEFDVAMQKKLLRAASYGMHFGYKDGNGEGSVMGNNDHDSAHFPQDHGGDGRFDELKNSLYEADATMDVANTTLPSPTAFKFVAAAKKIRVLNALRNPSVGLILTSAQYDEITPTGVIARLVVMKRPALANSLCSYLNLERSVHAFARASRAAAFVASVDKKAMTDSQVTDMAIRMLTEDSSSSSSSSTSSKTKGGANSKNNSNKSALMDSASNRGAYATVALSAHRAGRPGVASDLLRFETSVIDKVPAVIAIGMYPEAAKVAATAMDTDLIFLTLMEFEKSCLASTPDPSKAKMKFVSTVVSKFPREASELLKLYYASMKDVKNLNHFLFVAQNFTDAGNIIAKRAVERNGREERVASIKEASRIFGLGKECAFQKQCTDDYLELLSEQDRLRSTYESDLVAPESSSVTLTLESILAYASVVPRQMHKLFNEADKLAKRFRVPEKRLWHIKVNAFGKSSQWTNLRVLADSRAKSPIGFKPFAMAVIKGRQPVSDIMRYVERVVEPEDRYYLFCEAKLWLRAVEEAVALRDGSRIIHVRSICGNPDVEATCDGVLNKMFG